jgi:hypothetical protein
MGKVYDIMGRLTNEKPIIKIDPAHEYKVNNSKNQAIFIKQLSEDPKLDDFQRLDTIIEAALGKEALDYINSLNLSVKATGTVINAIMAAISEEDLEAVEKEAEKQKKSFRK